jgi:hypothetical protein
VRWGDFGRRVSGPILVTLYVAHYVIEQLIDTTCSQRYTNEAHGDTLLRFTACLYESRPKMSAFGLQRVKA